MRNQRSFAAGDLLGAPSPNGPADSCSRNEDNESQPENGRSGCPSTNNPPLIGSEPTSISSTTFAIVGAPLSRRRVSLARVPFASECLLFWVSGVEWIGCALIPHPPLKAADLTALNPRCLVRARLRRLRQSAFAPLRACASSIEAAVFESLRTCRTFKHRLRQRRLRERPERPLSRFLTGLVIAGTVREAGCSYLERTLNKSGRGLIAVDLARTRGHRWGQRAQSPSRERSFGSAAALSWR